MPDEVLKAYGVEYLAFGPTTSSPSPSTPGCSVGGAGGGPDGHRGGGGTSPVARTRRCTRKHLRRRFQASYGLIHTVTVKAQEKPMTVVYPHGADIRIVRAARRVVDEGIGGAGHPGRTGIGWSVAAEYRIPLDGVRLLDPTADGEPRARHMPTPSMSCASDKGMTPGAAAAWVLDPNVFAVLDDPAGRRRRRARRAHHRLPGHGAARLQILKLEEGRTIASALYVVVVSGRPYFFADCAVNIQPTSAQLAEIARSTAAIAREQFDVNPRVAFISYSNFESAGGEEPARVREAVELCRQLEPDLPVEGEMHADTAVVASLLERRKPGSRLEGRSANVLIFPNLTAANASYKLLNRLGDAEVIGPILTGLARSVHVLQLDAEVGDVVNLTAIAVHDADRKQRVEAPTG